MEYDNSSFFQTVWGPIASVGWYVVGLLMITYYVFPHIQEKFRNWELIKSQQDEAACSKKTDEILKEMANVALARQKLQVSYEQSCVLAQIKQEEQKEKKRQQLIKSLESKNVGKRLGSSTDDTPSTSTKSKSLKSGYNPLMGDHSRGYRPPKRSCCGKGGCG